MPAWARLGPARLANQDMSCWPRLTTQTQHAHLSGRARAPRAHLARLGLDKHGATEEAPKAPSHFFLRARPQLPPSPCPRPRAISSSSLNRRVTSSSTALRRPPLPCLVSSSSSGPNVVLLLYHLRVGPVVQSRSTEPGTHPNMAHSVGPCRLGPATVWPVQCLRRTNSSVL